MRPSSPKLILVPTDFSEPAAHALRYASALGERFGCHLLVIYADSFVLPIDLPTDSAPIPLSREQMIEEAREALQRHAEQNISERVPFDTQVIAESPVNGIVGHACDAGADLIVMGTHGRSGFRRLLVGSIAEAVMREATVPVIAVNAFASTGASVRKVLCPVSFTAASREALRSAAALADNSRVPLVLFHATEKQELENTIRELICLQDWAPTELAGRCDVRIVPRHASAQDIVAFARLATADLIAAGIPAGRTLAEVLRGTVAERIVQNSGCPVLVVNAATAAALASGDRPAAPAEAVAPDARRE